MAQATIDQIRASVVHSSTRAIYIEVTAESNTFNLAAIRAESNGLNVDITEENVPDVTATSAATEVTEYKLSTDIESVYLSEDPIHKMVEGFIFGQTTGAATHKRVLIVHLNSTLDGIEDAWIASDATISAKGLPNEAQNNSKISYSINYGTLAVQDKTKLTLGDAVVTLATN